MSRKVIQPWPELSNTLLQKTRVFDLHSKRLRSPLNGHEDDFYYIDTVDWVNIIPITKQREIVLVEQFRFGISQNTLELPGGMLDPEEVDPMKAAVRELEEETGFVPQGETLELGYVHPNPAMQTNRCHLYVSYDVEEKVSQNLDQSEDIAIHIVPMAEVLELIHNHKITHSLVICALYKFFASCTQQFKAKAPTTLHL